MQVRIAWGIWWLGLTLAWAAAAAPWQGMAAASEPAFWWQLRQHALYLSGIWSIGMMSLVMLLSLRQRWMERPLGGMDQVYRLHKWAGIAAAVAAVLHWGAKESSGLIKGMVGTAGRVPREAVLSWATDWRGTAKDLGEWAFYALLIMVVLTLWQRLLPYRPWRKLHRVMPALYLLLAFHTLALTPLTFWQAPLGMVMAALLLVGSVAALWSLAGRIGRGRNRYAAQVHEARVLGGAAGQAPLEVLCAMPKNWPGHRAGQFVFASFEGAEGPHPFTIASAPEGCGRTADGKELLRLVIKPLGDYTRRLPSLLQPGQAVQIEGPYGCFDAQGGAARTQVWVAGGVGITPFLALLQARQPGVAGRDGLQPAHLHYCTRNAAQDVLLPQLQALCEAAQPSVRLQVHDAAQGEYLTPEHLAQYGAQLDIWLCGPAGLGKAMRQAQQRGWRIHQEAFQMR
ncbi:ferredoxin reductase family protein [Comamonas kerstersii]|uniref:Ferric reductase n=1 Tax=Comamonas kerstersii TaxID=225992 RepID=A0A0W7Z0V9_9BURK|nr:ferric reductase-like transmembrane domain-containing protein [Comamonas kerstersii]AQZ98577.1 ferric reductase [Comamonas kerstersii]KUF40936.1 ferric reductase [Comamonas kerstersii]QTW20121.1 ferric reductase-like transmembrane domain-containing protein [Comamonas kerstersii]HBW62605.1 ferric reductase [Comamonas kerstersii]